jgi:tRNA(Ile)-lysidine synthase
LEIVDQLPDKFTKQELYFSENAIEGELRIRKWKTGDRMRPIGLNGSKLISDILTDAKIPHHNRSNQLVVEDNRKIIWCVGLAIDQCCAGSGESTNATILKLTLNLPHESPISSRF